jgi:hypothetical protein
MIKKAFNSMYAIDNPAMKIAAMHHSYESFEKNLTEA